MNALQARFAVIHRRANSGNRSSPPPNAFQTKCAKVAIPGPQPETLDEAVKKYVASGPCLARESDGGETRRSRRF